MGCHISKMKPPEGPMLPFVEMPRPLQESNVIGKGGAAGFLGKAYDPYRLYQDPNQPIQLGDLALRADVPPDRLKDRFYLLKGINGSMPDLEKAVSSYALDDYYQKAYSLLLSGKARDAFDLEKEKPEVRDKYGRTTFGQGLLLARRLVEAGTQHGDRLLPNRGEYLGMILLGTSGLMFLVGSEELLMIFIGLELTSLSLYVLTAFDKSDIHSAEAGLKYFLFGSTASAFTLFGLSLIYGMTGTTALVDIGQ